MRINRLLCTLAMALIGSLAGCDSASNDSPTASTSTTTVTNTPVAGVYISGKIVDPTTGTPVSGVRVGLKKSRLFTHTDKNGNYVIASANVIAARVAGRTAATDSTQTYVDTTKAALSDTTVAATVADSVQVTADTTTLASTEVYSKVDSAVPQIKVVQRNFGGNFQPYAPAGVNVWLEVYKNDSVKTPITNQKLGLMTAMASGTIPGYSGFVYFKYNKDETYDFTVRVIVWNKDSTAITTGSDYMSCESNIGDVTFPTLNGSGYIVPSQFLVQGADTVSVDSAYSVKLAQVAWDGINWHYDTGATFQYTYKFPSAYAPALISAGKHGVFNDSIRGFIFGDSANDGFGASNFMASYLSGYNIYSSGSFTRHDSLLWYANGTVSWKISLPAYSQYTKYLDSTFKLTISKDSLLTWAKAMNAKGVVTHLWDSAYKAGIYVYRDTISCGPGAFAVKTKDSTIVSKGLVGSVINFRIPVYEFFYYGAVAPSAFDSVTVSGPAPLWALKDTTGSFAVPAPASLTAKMKEAEDLLAAQSVLCAKRVTAIPGANPGKYRFVPTTQTWDPTTGWAGVRLYAPKSSFTLTTKLVNHLGTAVGTVNTNTQALTVR